MQWSLPMRYWRRCDVHRNGPPGGTLLNAIVIDAGFAPSEVALNDDFD
jgi:hypothetical protein